MTDRLTRTRHDYQIAAIKIRFALISLRVIWIKAGFRQDQPRGDDGRWDGGSGRFKITRKYNTGDIRIDSRTDILADTVKDVAEKIGPSSGR